MAQWDLENGCLNLQQHVNEACKHLFCVLHWHFWEKPGLKVHRWFIEVLVRTCPERKSWPTLYHSFYAVSIRRLGDRFIFWPITMNHRDHIDYSALRYTLEGLSCTSTVYDAFITSSLFKMIVSPLIIHHLWLIIYDASSLCLNLTHFYDLSLLN